MRGIVYVALAVPDVASLESKNTDAPVSIVAICDISSVARPSTSGAASRNRLKDCLTHGYRDRVYRSTNPTAAASYRRRWCVGWRDYCWT